MKDILRKIKLFDVIRAILLVFFLGVLLYPTVSDYLGRIHSSKAILKLDLIKLSNYLILLIIFLKIPKILINLIVKIAFIVKKLA